MSVSEPFVIPGPRAVARRALPNVIEGKLVPLVLFVGCFRVFNTAAALVAALAWSGGAILYRRARGQRVPGLLVLSLAGLAGKTVVALATGSMILYFLQPTATTAIVGLTFLGSTLARRPLAERLVHDLWPLEARWSTHVVLRRFFTCLSVLWAITSLANAGITLWLLLTQPLTTFVMVKSILGPLSAAGAVVPAVMWLRVALARHGVQVVFASRFVTADQPAPGDVPVLAAA